jgi:hypothetical protein
MWMWGSQTQLQALNRPSPYSFIPENEQARQTRLMINPIVGGQHRQPPSKGDRNITDKQILEINTSDEEAFANYDSIIQQESVYKSIVNNDKNVKPTINYLRMLNAQAALLEFRDNPAFVTQWRAEIATAVRENHDYWAMLDPAEWNKRSPEFRTQLVRISNNETPFNQNLQQYFPGGLNAILRARPIDVPKTIEEARAKEAAATAKRAEEYIQRGFGNSLNIQEIQHRNAEYLDYNLLLISSLS